MRPRLLPCLFLLPLALSAAVIEGDVRDITGTNSLNTAVRFTPLSFPVSVDSGTAVAAGPARTIVPKAGLFTNSFAPGVYKVSIGAFDFYIGVPDDSNTYSLPDLATNGLITYTYTNPIPYNVIAGATGIAISTNGANFYITNTLPGMSNLTDTGSAMLSLTDNSEIRGDTTMTFSDSNGDDALIIDTATPRIHSLGAAHIGGHLWASNGVTAVAGGITNHTASGFVGNLINATNLNAANIKAGTIHAAADGAALTNLAAANITAGGTLPALNAANLTNLASLRVVNVMHYGATGDGTTEDTDAIQAAIAAGTNAYIYFPNGTYRVSKTTNTVTQEGKHALTLWSDRHLIGESRDGVILKPLDSETNNMPILFFPTNQYGNVSIENLTIDGNNGRAGVTDAQSEDEGINFKGGTNMVIRNVFIHSCGQDAIDIDYSRGLVVERCVLSNNWGSGIHAAGSGTTFATIRDNRLYTNGFNRTVEGGLTAFGQGNLGIDSVQYSQIVNNYCQDGGSYNLMMNTNCAFNNIQGNWFYQTADSASINGTNVSQLTNVWIIGASYNTIDGNKIQHTTSSSAFGIRADSVQAFNIVRANTFIGSTYGIYHAAGRRAQYLNNRFYTANNACVIILAGDDILIEGNLMEGLAATSGINLNVSGTGTNIVVRGNIITVGEIRNDRTAAATVINNIIQGELDVRGTGGRYKGNSASSLLVTGAGTGGTFEDNNFSAVTWTSTSPTNSVFFYNRGVLATNNPCGSIDFDIKQPTNPADSTSYYAGPGRATSLSLATAHASVAGSVARPGYVRGYWLKVRYVAGSGESVTNMVSISGSVTTTVGSTTSTWDSGGLETTVQVTGIRQAVQPGDTVSIQIDCPAWATNPTAVYVMGAIYLE